MTEGSLPGLDYVTSHDGQAKCSLCDAAAPAPVQEGGHVAFCESCTHLAYLAWGSLPGEALPDLRSPPGGCPRSRSSSRGVGWCAAWTPRQGRRRASS